MKRTAIIAIFFFMFVVPASTSPLLRATVKKHLQDRNATAQTFEDIEGMAKSITTVAPAVPTIMTAMTTFWAATTATATTTAALAVEPPDFARTTTVLGRGGVVNTTVALAMPTSTAAPTIVGASTIGASTTSAFVMPTSTAAPTLAGAATAGATTTAAWAVSTSTAGPTLAGAATGGATSTAALAMPTEPLAPTLARATAAGATTTASVSSAAPITDWFDGTCNCIYFEIGKSAGCSGECCSAGLALDGGHGWDRDCRREETRLSCVSLRNGFGQFFCAWTTSGGTVYTHKNGTDDFEKNQYQAHLQKQLQQAQNQLDDLQNMHGASGAEAKQTVGASGIESKVGVATEQSPHSQNQLDDLRAKVEEAESAEQSSKEALEKSLQKQEEMEKELEAAENEAEMQKQLQRQMDELKNHIGAVSEQMDAAENTFQEADLAEQKAEQKAEEAEMAEQELRDALKKSLQKQEEMRQEQKAQEVLHEQLQKQKEEKFQKKMDALKEQLEAAELKNLDADFDRLKVIAHEQKAEEAELAEQKSKEALEKSLQKQEEMEKELQAEEALQKQKEEDFKKKMDAVNEQLWAAEYEILEADLAEQKAEEAKMAEQKSKDALEKSLQKQEEMEKELQAEEDLQKQLQKQKEEFKKKIDELKNHIDVLNEQLSTPAPTMGGATTARAALAMPTSTSAPTIVGATTAGATTTAATTTADWAFGTCHCIYFEIGKSAGCSGECCSAGLALDGGHGWDRDCRREENPLTCVSLRNGFGQYFCAWTTSVGTVYTHKNGTRDPKEYQAHLQKQLQQAQNQLDDLQSMHGASGAEAEQTVGASGIESKVGAATEQSPHSQKQLDDLRAKVEEAELAEQSSKEALEESLQKQEEMEKELELTKEKLQTAEAKLAKLQKDLGES